MARVRGKVTVASQVYIGSPEKVLGLMKDSSTDKADSLTRLKVEEFGALWAPCRWILIST